MRERERQRQTETDRQRQRQTDRGRQTHTHTHNITSHLNQDKKRVLFLRLVHPLQLLRVESVPDRHSTKRESKDTKSKKEKEV